MNAALKITIHLTPDGRFVAQSKIEGRFAVWRALVTRAEVEEWVCNEIGCIAGDRPGTEADEPDAGAVGSLPSRPELKETVIFSNADLQPVAEPGYLWVDRGAGHAKVDDDMDRWVEAEPAPVAAAPDDAAPVKTVRRPSRSREEKIASLVDFVSRSLEGGSGPVRLTLKDFRTALDMTDQAVLDTVSFAVGSGLLAKASRTGEAGNKESWYSLPGAPSAPPAVPAPANAGRVAQLVEHVRALGGDRQMVKVSFAMLKQALGVSEPVVSQAIKTAVAEGLLIKQRRQGRVSVENWFGLLGAEAEGPKEDPEQSVVQQEGGEAAGKAEPDGSPAPSGMPAARMSPAELDAATARVSQRVAARGASVESAGPEVVPGCGLVLQSLRKTAEKIGMSAFAMPLGRLAANSGVDPKRLPSILAVLSKQGLIEHTAPKQAGRDHVFVINGGKA